MFESVEQELSPLKSIIFIEQNIDKLIQEIKARILKSIEEETDAPSDKYCGDVYRIGSGHPELISSYIDSLDLKLSNKKKENLIRDIYKLIGRELTTIDRQQMVDSHHFMYHIWGLDSPIFTTFARSLAYSSITLLNLCKRTRGYQDNYVQDYHAQVIAEALPGSCISKLNINATELTREGVLVIAKAVANENCKVISFTLHCPVRLSDQDLADVINILAKSKVESLQIRNANFGPLSAIALGNALTVSNIMTLSLVQCGIDDIYLWSIVKKLRSSKLINLHMSSDLITAYGLKGLATAIPGSKLRRLQLNPGLPDSKFQILVNCLVNEEGVTATNLVNLGETLNSYFPHGNARRFIPKTSVRTVGYILSENSFRNRLRFEGAMSLVNAKFGSIKSADGSRVIEIPKLVLQKIAIALCPDLNRRVYHPFKFYLGQRPAQDLPMPKYIAIERVSQSYKVRQREQNQMEKGDIRSCQLRSVNRSF